jgi:hypothetical protein
MTAPLGSFAPLEGTTERRDANPTRQFRVRLRAEPGACPGRARRRAVAFDPRKAMALNSIADGFGKDGKSVIVSAQAG